jgi:hypothetical protein
MQYHAIDMHSMVVIQNRRGWCANLEGNVKSPCRGFQSARRGCHGKRSHNRRNSFGKQGGMEAATHNGVGGIAREHLPETSSDDRSFASGAPQELRTLWWILQGRRSATTAAAVSAAPTPTHALLMCVSD